jgi:hypothetical protein
MPRLLTAFLAVLLTAGGISANPPTRIRTGRDSSCIIWVFQRDGEQVRITTAFRRPARSVLQSVPQYRAPACAGDPAFTLFQRPPPFIA